MSFRPGVVTAIMVMVVAACVPARPPVPYVPMPPILSAEERREQTFQRSLERAEESAQMWRDHFLPPGRTFNENWYVDCRTDRVTNVRTCWARTITVPVHIMEASRIARAGEWRILEIQFEGGRGPYVVIYGHDFPGRYPQIRFDDDSAPLTVSDDGGVRGHFPDPGIVQRMRSAGSAIARYHEWPDGQRVGEWDLTGFDAAYRELVRVVQGAVAVSERGDEVDAAPNADVVSPNAE